MTRALDLSEKQSFQLVWFSHGGGDLFLTDWTADRSYQGNVYLSRPSMELKIPKNTGTLEDVRATIDLSLESGLLTNLTSGDVHAPVEVTVYEVNLPTSSGPSATVRNVFMGTVVQASRNVSGRRGMVRIYAQPDKAAMDVSMGEPCNHQCSNTLGDARCQVDMSNGHNSLFRTVNAMADRILTLSAATLLNSDDRYYHRGSITFQGLTIMIREWRSADPRTFQMIRRPPASWLNQSVFVSSGCDKSVETCDRRYANKEHFRGNGYAMLNYNPLFEKGV